MTDRWTVETEELVARAVGSRFGDGWLEHWEPGTVAWDSWWAQCREEAQRILTALADAGLLLAPGGETQDLDLLETAWGIIANVTPWSGQNAEWQDAASRWRERYHEVLGIGGGP